MDINQKGFANIALIALVVVLAGTVGYFALVKKQEPVAQQTTPPSTTTQTPTSQQPSPTPINETANWKTYRNDKFGFEFKYPAELIAVSSGPSEEQQKLDRGEMISGTVPPSYDTITFSNSTKTEQFNVVVFPIRKDEISSAGFKGYSSNGVIMSGYLSMGSACDTRWMDSISEEPTLVKKNGISVLEVQVIAGGPKEGFSNGCYYFKNSGGNLVVFNISGLEQKSYFLNVFHLVGDKILPTLSLIK